MNKLFIPNKIKAGFQSRSDTYNGNLGYVIYQDEKNKWRKETSWENWRDKKIDPQFFDNTPMEGFVINRNVGGVSGYRSWYEHDRIEKVRVFDPRGFEIEITIGNLLYLLQESVCDMGKGLQAKCVYAWWGASLVLMPVGTKEYNESMKHTIKQHQKIDRKSMVEGYTYDFKDGEVGIYLGRRNYYKRDYAYDLNPEFKEDEARGRRYGHNYSNGRYIYKHINSRVERMGSIQHVFYIPSSKKYRIEKGFTKIASVVNDAVCDDYAELLENFQNSRYGNKIVDVELVETQIDFDEIEKYKNDNKPDYYNRFGDGKNLFVKVNGDITKAKLVIKTRRLENREYEYEDGVFYEQGGYYQKHEVTGNWGEYDRRGPRNIPEQTKGVKFYKAFAVLENGVKIPLEGCFNYGS